MTNKMALSLILNAENPQVATDNAYHPHGIPSQTGLSIRNRLLDFKNSSTKTKSGTLTHS
jgi:hypothetical protein